MFVSSLKKLNKNNISVELTFYINDEVNNLTDYQKVTEIAQTVAKLNDTVQIDAVHLDQEPSDAAQYEALV